MSTEGASNALTQLRAERREQKRRLKMAVHGRGVKKLPSGGIVAAAKKSLLR